MKVCIAEKPSVAKEIAQVIGANTRMDGYYEGNGYQVTWTFGHFCTLYPPEDYNAHWKYWDLNTLPMLPERFETKVMDDGGVKKQYTVIKKLFDAAECVINCGDAGQEGELIQRWVMKQAKYQGKVQRLWISSLTTEAIKTGFGNLRAAEEFDNLYYAGSSRAIGDWLLGMNATRLYTLRYAPPKQVLSIGRVQTPTLAMLVKRHLEIAHFKPQPYWELYTIYRDTKFNHTEGKFHKQEDGQQLLQRIDGKPLTITKVEKKEGKEYAPKLFDLTALQVHCNNKFGFTAESTLKLVQSLYEKKVVTYPRVDTTFLPNDMFPKISGILKNLTHYAQFTATILSGEIRKSKKVFNDNKVTDHHAIVPTGEQTAMSPDEQRVYDAITRRFLAVFYPDCLVAKTEVRATVGGITFVAKGKEILAEGWKILFPKEKKKPEEEGHKEEEEENILPSFEKGENGPQAPALVEKITKPPKNFTEATLLRGMETAGKQVENEELQNLMKANGIGRPSTRANIIETLFKRKYAERKKKNVVPTTLGIRLIETIQNQLLKSAELTGHWEKKLKEIESGEYKARDFIENMKKMVDQLVYEVRMEQGRPRLSIENTVKPGKVPAKKKVLIGHECPKCKKGRILKGKELYGCSEWKAGCDFRMPFQVLNKKLTESQLIRLVEKGATTKLKGFEVNGKKTEGLLKFDSDMVVRFEDQSPKPGQAPAQETCPKCKNGHIIKGKTAYGCSRWKEGCDFRRAL